MGTQPGAACPAPHSRQAVPREGAQGLQKAGCRGLLPTGDWGERTWGPPQGLPSPVPRPASPKCRAQAGSSSGLGTPGLKLLYVLGKAQLTPGTHSHCGGNRLTRAHTSLHRRDLVTQTAGTWASNSQGALSPCPCPTWAAPCNPASLRVLLGNRAFIKQMEKGQASPARLPGAACPPTAPGASPRSQASPPQGLTQPGPLLGWGKAEGQLEAEVRDPRVQPPPEEPHPFPISPPDTG